VRGGRQNPSRERTEERQKWRRRVMRQRWQAAGKQARRGAAKWRQPVNAALRDTAPVRNQRRNPIQRQPAPAAAIRQREVLPNRFTARSGSGEGGGKMNPSHAPFLLQTVAPGAVRGGAARELAPTIAIVKGTPPGVGVQRNQQPRSSRKYRRQAVYGTTPTGERTECSR